MSDVYSVLVVEDERIVARDLQETLQDLGYDAFAIAASAAEAIARAEERRPDIVLLDIRINGDVDGITAAAQLRERFGVPVIFLTAHADDATLERATQTEPQGYLVKPVRPAELKSAIEVARHRLRVERRAREAEAALRASEARYRLIVETAREGIAIAGSDGRITYANGRMAELLGYDRPDLVGKHFSELVDPDTAKLAEEAFNPQRAGESAGHEWKLRHASGREVWVWAESNPIMVDGRFAGVLSMLTDVSEEKRAEQAQEALRAKMIIADRLSAIGLLAAGVGHEINNPLTFILWNLDMLSRELPKLAEASTRVSVGSLERMVSEAREGAERVRRIVKGLKTFARGEEGVPHVIDVAEIVDMSVEMAANELRHRARIVREYGDSPRIEADEARLGQVFLNLLVNAAHAIPEGHADANEVRVVTGTTPEGSAFVEVRDTGSGIPDDAKPRVFEPFFTTKDVGAGTGLGLAVCHGIVTSLGGEISFESTSGAGTTFRVVLPPATAELRAPAPSQQHRAAEPVRRILVVDDDAAVAAALRWMLAPHDVTVAVHGKSALELIESSPAFDLVFCDLMMPVMTGMDLFAALAARGSPMVDRIVFITGGAFTPTARKFIDAIPNKTLEKPFAFDQIRDALRALA